MARQTHWQMMERIDRIVKASIRAMLVIASLNMVLGNLHSKEPNSIVASVLFLLANLSALAWIDLRRR